MPPSLSHSDDDYGGEGEDHLERACAEGSVKYRGGAEVDRIKGVYRWFENPLPGHFIAYSVSFRITVTI